MNTESSNAVKPIETGQASINSKSPPGQATKGERQKKIPKKITETYLQNSGLYYLERFSASSGHFRSVMARKIHKSCHVHKDQDPGACMQMLDRVIDKFQSLGYLNDFEYVRSRVASLRRRGLSRKAIEAKLRAQSISSNQITAALNTYREENGMLSESDLELAAALKLAKKKRIGPFFAGTNPEDKHKSLAMMARAGFSYETSRKALAYEKEDAFLMD